MHKILENIGIDIAIFVTRKLGLGKRLLDLSTQSVSNGISDEFKSSYLLVGTAWSSYSDSSSLNIKKEYYLYSNAALSG